MHVSQLAYAPAPSGAGPFYARSSARHLLGLEGLPRESLLAILDDAEGDLARLSTDRSPTEELRLLTVVIAMFEDSTRTRVSFQIAAKRLGPRSPPSRATGSRSARARPCATPCASSRPTART